MHARVVIAVTALVLATTALTGCGGTSTSKPALGHKLAGVPSSPYSEGNYPGILKIGNPYDIQGRTYYPAHQPDYVEEGIASWYGPGFHGRSTANGERFDQNSLTAAHRTLPMPSVVRVTNLENGRVATLTVNDRGPFAKDRIIDLSKRAATELGVIAKGTAKVRVEYLEPETRALIANLLENNRIKADDATLRMLAMHDLKPDAAAARQIAASSTAFTGGQERGISDRAPLAPVASRALENPQGRVMESAQAQHEAARVARIERPAAQPTPPISYEQGGVVSRTMPSAPPADYAPPRQYDAVPAGEVPVAPAITPPPPVEEYPPSPNSLQELPQHVQHATGQQVAIAGRTFIQAGSFGHESNAHDLSRRLAALGRTIVKPVDVNGKTWYRVRLGPLQDSHEVQTALQQVKGMGLADAHVVHD